MKQVVGYITQWTSRKVSGFAYLHATEGPTPVQVSLYWNGELLHERWAHDEHGFLKNHNIVGSFGFTFDLEKIYPCHPMDSLEVRVGNHVLPLMPGLAVLRAKDIVSRDAMSDLAFFVHIPKTAGTTMRFLLNDALPPASIWPNNEEVKLNSKRYFPMNAFDGLTEHRKRALKLVLGHLNVHMLDKLPVRPKVFTFLREPHAQYGSYVNHKVIQFPNFKRMSLSQALSHDAIIDNPQIRFFLPRTHGTGPINEEMFRLAVSNLKRCTVVGLTEQFDESLARISEQFQWRFGPIKSLNQNRKKRFASIDKSQIQDRIQWDLKFYAEAVKIFNNYS